MRELIRDTAAEMDELGGAAVSDRISMCNFRANRLVCEAADRAIQVHGGIGYTRSMPFEHIHVGADLTRGWRQDTEQPPVRASVGGGCRF